MTQEHAATLLGISQQQISQYEKGVRTPRYDRLRIILKNYWEYMFDRDITNFDAFGEYCAYFIQRDCPYKSPIEFIQNSEDAKSESFIKQSELKKYIEDIVYDVLRRYVMVCHIDPM